MPAVPYQPDFIINSDKQKRPWAAIKRRGLFLFCVFQN
ncbi:Uncharacterized protein dnm_064630 [Desulfonema magnum]|uniref:Uncharacterized protein n=1 Tax=Desulfonema magnum TaxID=45655 RepID=A0A975GR03_9BACT|nr:Uncharacterized protein dnm_064630 [Desulfonema magnum]